MVYSHKQTELENLVEVIQEMSLSDTLQKEGMSFCLTRYKTGRHTAPNCPCEKGFSITRATINLPRWQGNFTMGTQEVSVLSLSGMG